MGTKSRSAQAMIEYVMILVLVLAALIFGGPFLVNSIGARFQGMGDTTQDAVDEQIIQAAPPVCTCNPAGPYWTWPLAQPEVCAPAGCGLMEKKRKRTCNPSLCDMTQKCVPHNECCIAPVAGACGTVHNGELQMEDPGGELDGSGGNPGGNGNGQNDGGGDQTYGMNAGGSVPGPGGMPADGGSGNSQMDGGDGQNDGGDGQNDGGTDEGGPIMIIPNLCASREPDNPDPIIKAKIQELLPGTPDDDIKSRCMDSGGSVRGCLKGERMYTADCGQNYKRYACVVDAACPP